MERYKGYIFKAYSNGNQKLVDDFVSFLRGSRMSDDDIEKLGHHINLFYVSKKSSDKNENTKDNNDTTSLKK